MKKIKTILKADVPTEEATPVKETPKALPKIALPDVKIPVSLNGVFKTVQDAIKANASENEINSLIFVASLAAMDDAKTRKESVIDVPPTQLPIVRLRENISAITYGKCCNACATGAISSVTLHFKNYYPSTFKIDNYIISCNSHLGNITLQQ
jgi:hypothetical protein